MSRSLLLIVALVATFACVCFGASITQYSDSSCTTVATAAQYVTPNVCQVESATESSMLTCNDLQVGASFYSASTTCTGDATTSAFRNATLPASTCFALGTVGYVTIDCTATAPSSSTGGNGGASASTGKSGSASTLTVSGLVALLVAMLSLALVQ